MTRLSRGVIGTRCPTCQAMIPLGRVHDCAILVVPPEPKAKAA